MEPQTSPQPPPTHSQVLQPLDPPAHKGKCIESESRSRSASSGVQRLAEARARARNRLKVVGSRVRTVSSKINQRTAAWRARRRLPKTCVPDSVDLPPPAVLAILAELGEVWHASASPQDTEYEMLLERLWAATHGRGFMTCDTDTACTESALQAPSPFCRSGLGWIQLGFQRSCPDHDFLGGGVLSLQCLVYLAERNPMLCNDVPAGGPDTAEASFEGPFSLQNVLRARKQRRKTHGERVGKGTSRWDASAVEVVCDTTAKVIDDGGAAGVHSASGGDNSGDQVDLWLADEYPIAVSGINITSILCALLQIGDPPDMLEPQSWWPLIRSQNSFFELYCAAFRLLDAQWHAPGTADSQKLGAVLEGTRLAVFALLDVLANATVIDVGLDVQSTNNPNQEKTSSALMHAIIDEVLLRGGAAEICALGSISDETDAQAAVSSLFVSAAQTVTGHRHKREVCNDVHYEDDLCMGDDGDYSSDGDTGIGALRRVKRFASEPLLDEAQSIMICDGDGRNGSSDACTSPSPRVRSRAASALSALRAAGRKAGRKMTRNRSGRASWGHSGKESSHGSGTADGTDSGELPTKLSVPDFVFSEDMGEGLVPSESDTRIGGSNSNDAGLNDNCSTGGGDDPVAPTSRRVMSRLGSRSRQSTDTTAVAVAVAEGADGRALLDAARARAAARGAAAATSDANNNSSDGKDVVDMISGALAALDSGDIPDVSPMKQAHPPLQLQQPQANPPDGVSWVSDTLSDAFEAEIST